MKKSTRNFLIALVIVISVAAIGYMSKMTIDGKGFNIFNTKIDNKDNSKEEKLEDNKVNEKKELTDKEFTEILKNEGFNVTDEKDLVKDASVESMLFAKAKNDGYQLEFIVYPNNEISKRSFSNRRSKIAADYNIDLEGDLDKVDNESKEDFNVYKEEINDRFYYVSRVKNSMLNINAPIEYKKEILNIIEKLNY